MRRLVLLTKEFLKYADKFSRHLIFIIPKVAFKDNSHVGTFVREVCFNRYFTFIA